MKIYDKLCAFAALQEKNLFAAKSQRTIASFDRKTRARYDASLEIYFPKSATVKSYD